MFTSVLYVSMSLDGFITGPDDDADQGLGRGGERLHGWLGDAVDGPPHFQPPGASGEVFDELMETGAVLVGRRTFDHAGHWGGDHHGVPIFVPTKGRAARAGLRPGPLRDRRHRERDEAGQEGSGRR